MVQPLIKSYWKDSGMQIDEKKTKTCGIIEGNMALLKKCWEDGGMQIFEGITKTCRIKSKLQDMEVLLMSELPTSKRDKFQACSYSLRAEANPIMKKIVFYTPFGGTSAGRSEQMLDDLEFKGLFGVVLVDNVSGEVYWKDAIFVFDALSIT
ncbi:hypothetical protein Tco_0593291 [Tanacetum coccineum]